MDNYQYEPVTKGKIILHTSFGDIDIELWPKEAPMAVRNFVQLGLEGYYDGTIFHRIVKDLLIQGGDPTGTGDGGDSIYGGPFKDEIHSRLRFNHRGIVAMANENKPNTNFSQFFITFTDTKFFQNKYTIFGKVTGDTIFNVLRTNEIETDENEKPIRKLQLLSMEVLSLPFDDIYPRNIIHEHQQKRVIEEPKEEKPVVKRVKNNSLISFDNEFDDIPDELTNIKSLHESINDPLLKNETKIIIPEMKGKENENKLKLSIKNALNNQTEEIPESAEMLKLKEQEKQIQDRLESLNNAKTNEAENEKLSEIEKMRENLKKRRAIELELGKKGDQKSEVVEKETLHSKLELQRLKYKRRKEIMKGREDHTLDLLDKFKRKLDDVTSRSQMQDLTQINKVVKTNPDPEPIDEDNLQGTLASYLPEVEKIKEEDEEEDVGDEWMATHLKFKKHFEDFYRTGDMSYNPEVDDYTVVDPLMEQMEKERILVERKKQLYDNQKAKKK